MICDVRRRRSSARGGVPRELSKKVLNHAKERRRRDGHLRPYAYMPEKKAIFDF
jgi:hypothetical protein